MKPAVGLATLVAIVAAIAVAVVFVSTDDEQTSDATVPSASTPSIEGSSPATADPAADTSDEELDDLDQDLALDPIEATSGTAACLVGGWRLDSDAFVEAVFESAQADVQNQATFEFVGGTYSLEVLSDLSYSSERTDWTLRFITTEGTVYNTFNGGQTGTLSASGTMLTWHDDTSAVTIKLEVEIGGERQEIPFGGDQIVSAEATSGTGLYSCNGDTLTATNEGITSTWTRSTAGN